MRSGRRRRRRGDIMRERKRAIWMEGASQRGRIL